MAPKKGARPPSAKPEDIEPVDARFAPAAPLYPKSFVVLEEGAPPVPPTDYHLADATAWEDPDGLPAIPDALTKRLASSTPWVRVKDTVADNALVVTTCRPGKREAPAAFAVGQGDEDDDLPTACHPDLCWLVTCFELIAGHKDQIAPGCFLWELISPPERELDADPPLGPDFNENGMYIVKLFSHGSWRNVTIDDRMPVDSTGRNLFPHTVQSHEIWPALLAKALCKLGNGSNGLLNSEPAVLHALTGWWPRRVEMEPIFCWNLLSSLEFPLTTSMVSVACCKPQTAAQKDEHASVGLPVGFAYTVVEVRTVRNGSLPLIRLKNAHASWNGCYSTSDLGSWSEIEADVDGEPAENEFWMSFEDICYYFDSVCVTTDPASPGLATVETIDPVWNFTVYNPDPNFVPPPVTATPAAPASPGKDGELAEEEEGIDGQPLLLLIDSPEPTQIHICLNSAVEKFVPGSIMPVNGDAAPANMASALLLAVSWFANNNDDDGESAAAAASASPGDLSRPVASLTTSRCESTTITVPAGPRMYRIALDSTHGHSLSFAAPASAKMTLGSTYKCLTARGIVCNSFADSFDDLAEGSWQVLFRNSIRVGPTTPDPPDSVEGETEEERDGKIAAAQADADAQGLLPNLVAAEVRVPEELLPYARLCFVDNDDPLATSHYSMLSMPPRLMQPNKAGYTLALEVNIPAGVTVALGRWCAKVYSRAPLAECETIFENQRLDLADVYLPNRLNCIFRKTIELSEPSKAAAVALHMALLPKHKTAFFKLELLDNGAQVWSRLERFSQTIISVNLEGNSPAVKGEGDEELQPEVTHKYVLQAIAQEKSIVIPNSATERLINHAENPVSEEEVVAEDASENKEVVPETTTKAPDKKAADKKKGASAEPDALDETLLEKPGALGWRLRIVANQTLKVDTDTEREDKQAAIRESWEKDSDQPGRAARAKLAREVYLNSLLPAEEQEALAAAMSNKGGKGSAAQANAGEETPAEVEKREARSLGVNEKPSVIPAEEGKPVELLHEPTWVSANTAVEGKVTVFNDNMSVAENNNERAASEREQAVKLKADERLKWYAGVADTHLDAKVKRADYLARKEQERLQREEEAAAAAAALELENAPPVEPSTSGSSKKK